MPVSRVRATRKPKDIKPARLARAMERNRNRLAYFAGLRKNADIGVDPQYLNGRRMGLDDWRKDWLKASKAWDVAEAKRRAARRAA